MPEMHILELGLLKTRKTVWEACKDLGIDPEDIDTELLTTAQCSHCNVWHYEYRLKEDLDGSPICSYCESLVGL